MTTPADEIEAAAATLRPSSPAVAEHTTWVKIRPEAADAIAKLLREIAALHEPGCCGKPTANGSTCGAPHGCDWCSDEDWPCNDTRNALTVARAILAGGQP